MPAGTALSICERLTGFASCSVRSDADRFGTEILHHNGKSGLSGLAAFGFVGFSTILDFIQDLSLGIPTA